MSSPWHGEGLCLHANQTPPTSSPQFVSLLSIHYFKHPMTTSFNLKERGILKTTSDPPPTPGILNHPPNTLLTTPQRQRLSSLSTSPSPVLHHGGGGDWLVLSLILTPAICTGFRAERSGAVMPNKADGGTCGFQRTSATLRWYRCMRMFAHISCL